MKNEHLSIGSARILQLMILLFFILFVSFVTYIIMLNSPSLGGILFVIGSYGGAWLFIYQAMTYGDLTIVEGRLHIKKIINSKVYHLTDIKLVNKALLPYTFYIEFKNSKKVDFKNTSNFDTLKTLTELRLKIYGE